ALDPEIPVVANGPGAAFRAFSRSGRTSGLTFEATAPKAPPRGQREPVLALSLKGAAAGSDNRLASLRAMGARPARRLQAPAKPGWKTALQP
ncbi:hypothetical protein, partial [Haematobacter massiliensis]|uniref:hypothetical protein n=1 Tax=Haematobacter massiliensis TaxID=195105 RepID=UPI000B6387C5